MALELRFGVRARASGDLDLGIVASGGTLLEIFDRVLGVGFHDFTFERRGEPELLENAATYRLKVKIAYRGRPFGTLSIDLNEASHETATTVEQTGVLTALGLPGPLKVPLLEPYLQIAQKLHGATEPDRADYTNRRHRDLLDVLVMTTDERLPLDLRRLRTVAIEEFARRAHHKHWPPIFALPDAWRDPLELDARQIQFQWTDPDELTRHFIALIAEIEGVDVKQTHDYKFISVQMNLTGNEPVQDQAQRELQSFISDGWHFAYVGPRPGFIDQFLAILERRNNGGGASVLPRLQLRVDTEYLGDGTVALVGLLRNETPVPANRVRIFASSASEIVRLGTITQGDGEFKISIPYEKAALRTQPPQLGAIVVQYATDDGVRVEQTGILEADGPDASGRYTYKSKGLGPSRTIERFTVPHDALEDP